MTKRKTIFQKSVKQVRREDEALMDLQAERERAFKHVPPPGVLSAFDDKGNYIFPRNRTAPRIGTCYQDPKTGKMILAGDFPGEPDLMMDLTDLKREVDKMGLGPNFKERFEAAAQHLPKSDDSGRASDANRSILLEADALVNGDRQGAYGPAREDFGRTVALFKALTGIELTAAQGLEFMLCVKLSRSGYKFKRDNYVDLCGYASLLNDLLSETPTGASDTKGGGK